MENIINKIQDPQTNIDIIGNIFICDELCNLTFDYKDHNVIILTNNSTTNKDIKNKIPLLEISYNNVSNI